MWTLKLIITLLYKSETAVFATKKKIAIKKKKKNKKKKKKKTSSTHVIPW